jgi:hypothetical protein
MVHGRQRSSLSVATGLRRRCSADGKLMSRPANGRLAALLKLDLEQLKEAVAAPPPSNEVRSPKPSLGRQMRFRRLQRIAGAFPRIGLPHCRANPDPFLGDACRPAEHDSSLHRSHRPRLPG